MRFQYYTNIHGLWRWRLMLWDKIIAVSAEDYSSRGDCIAIIRKIKKAISTTPIPVEDITGLCVPPTRRQEKLQKID